MDLPDDALTIIRVTGDGPPSTAASVTVTYTVRVTRGTPAGAGSGDTTLKSLSVDVAVALNTGKRPRRSPASDPRRPQHDLRTVTVERRLRSIPYGQRRLPATSTAPRRRVNYGIWTAGTTIWVSPWFDVKLYANNHSTVTIDSAKDITLHADNDDSYGKLIVTGPPSGCGTPEMASSTPGQAHRWISRQRQGPSTWISTTTSLRASGPTATTMWMSDLPERQVLWAYALMQRNRRFNDLDKEFSLSDIQEHWCTNPLWSDGDHHLGSRPVS